LHAEALLIAPQDTDGRVRGAMCRDELSGEQFPVDARVVINAAGPFCDAVRRCVQLL
jgi:glycerol-3-phosphate dehydrogenase